MNLFDTAKSHRDDPLPSYIAAEKVDLTKQQAEVLQAFRDVFDEKRPCASALKGVTARELSRLTGMDYHKIQRRVNELESKNFIYRLDFLRDNMTVWGLIK